MLCWETDVPFDPPALLITLTWKLSNDSVDMLPLVEIAFDCSIVKHEKSAPWLRRWWKLWEEENHWPSIPWYAIDFNKKIWKDNLFKFHKWSRQKTIFFTVRLTVSFPPPTLLRSAFCEFLLFFFVFILDYNSMCSEMDFTPEKSFSLNNKNS